MPDNPNVQKFSPQKKIKTTDHPNDNIKIWISLTLLLMIALAVVFLPTVSPRRAEEPPIEEEIPLQHSKLQPKTEISTTHEGQPIPQSEALEEEPIPSPAAAQDSLQETLKLLARLVNQGVKIWGDETLETSYPQALETLAKADQFLNDKLYAQAAKNYQETIDKLHQLEQSRPLRVQRAIQSGDAAFTQLDSKTAQQYYNIALSADSNNQEIQAKLQRAINLPEVLNIINRGKSLESNNELDQAKEMYLRALQLDNTFQPTNEHLQRVNDRINDRDYQSAMTAAISALSNMNFLQAKQELATAKKLRPNDPGSLDLEKQLIEAEKNNRLQDLRTQVQTLEESERWEEAVQIYMQILEIDPNIGYAQTGKYWAEKFVELNRIILKYIANPSDLQSPEHREYATKIYQMTVKNNSVGPKFRANSSRLKELLHAYEQPTPVLLQSDSLTDVTIYRIGPLGHFLEHRLELLPGQYKAVGSRSGFRDVNISFTVPASTEEYTITVFCKEKI
ncbi:MAG: hypothetical protein K8S27_15920 [Candidatus Omnitrophica bacterium]|nr:hypothetical protein [Candidatus Omnitrophota bacterium]